MRVPLTLVCLLLACVLVHPEARAEDAPAKERWTYVKGDETRELDVTQMSESLRKALHTQLETAGWKRQVAATPILKKREVSPSTLKDIEELVKRGGKLPDGFVPHGMGERPAPGTAPKPPMPAGLGNLPPEMMGSVTQATGKLLLKYLEEKDDPVKGPVYEDILRKVATALAGGTSDLQGLGMQMMAEFMNGMQDPKKAPVYREIMSLFGGALMGGSAAPAPTPGPLHRAPPPPPAKPFGQDVPIAIGGARLAYVQGMDGRPGWTVFITQVPPGSTAASAGLKTGDRLEAIDGKPPQPASLKRAAEVLTKGGKLNLRLRRKDGTVEQLELDAVLDD